MAKVTYTGVADAVVNRGVEFPQGVAVEVSKDHAAALADNPYFEVAKPKK